MEAKKKGRERGREREEREERRGVAFQVDMGQQQTENKFPLIICENFLEKIMFPGIPRNGHNFFCDRSQKKCDHSLITK